VYIQSETSSLLCLETHSFVFHKKTGSGTMISAGVKIATSAKYLKSVFTKLTEPQRKLSGWVSRELEKRVCIRLLFLYSRRTSNLTQYDLLSSFFIFDRCPSSTVSCSLRSQIHPQSHQLTLAKRRSKKALKYQTLESKCLS